jgi:hypothetical protein
MYILRYALELALNFYQTNKHGINALLILMGFICLLCFLGALWLGESLPLHLD